MRWRRTRIGASLAHPPTHVRTLWPLRACCSEMLMSGRWGGRRRRMLGSGLAAWCALQLLIQEQHNTPAVLVLYVQALLAAALWTSGERAEATDFRPSAAYWLGCSGFFHLGNTNSFATLSLANAYAGFTPTARAGPAVVVLCNTYAAPVCMCFAGVLGARRLGVGAGQPARRVWLTLLAASSGNVAAAAAALLLHREHLFVWSVFAPKLAYACMAALAAHLAAGVCACTL
jgi:ethanolaminephosphotransferase